MKKNKKRLVVGLTGGIATGKSLILNQLKKLNWETISCDAISKKLFHRKDILSRITKKFKTCERNKIAKIIFSDKKQKSALERILLPEVLKELRKKISGFKKNGSGCMAVETPLLFELGLEDYFDLIITVYCPEEFQISRIRERDGISASEAKKRIFSQIPISKKVFMSDFVIDNSGEVKGIKKKLKNILDKINKKSKIIKNIKQFESVHSQKVTLNQKNMNE